MDPTIGEREHSPYRALWVILSERDIEYTWEGARRKVSMKVLGTILGGLNFISYDQ